MPEGSVAPTELIFDHGSLVVVFVWSSKRTFTFSERLDDLRAFIQAKPTNIVGWPCILQGSIASGNSRPASIRYTLVRRKDVQNIYLHCRSTSGPMNKAGEFWGPARVAD